MELQYQSCNSTATVVVNVKDDDNYNTDDNAVNIYNNNTITSILPILYNMHNDEFVGDTCGVGTNSIMLLMFYSWSMSVRFWDAACVVFMQGAVTCICLIGPMCAVAPTGA